DFAVADLADELAGGDAVGDDREPGGQRALPPVGTERAAVVLVELDEDLAGRVLDVRLARPEPARRGVDGFEHDEAVLAGEPVPRLTASRQQLADRFLPVDHPTPSR